ncbi:MAG: DNA helicase RecG, partial [Deltaproteobacteria bacterium]|nr:DNA helicase RecG [Deltaproteobacteria bacterium]
FVIAEEDLKIRGPGDFIGRRQSGLPEFRTADIFGDIRILKAARDDVEALLSKDPELSSVEGKSVKSVMASRWRGRLELAEIG